MAGSLQRQLYRVYGTAFAGHTVHDDKIYRKGILDFLQEIEHAMAKLDFSTTPGLCQAGRIEEHAPCRQRMIRFAGGMLANTGMRHVSSRSRYKPSEQPQVGASCICNFRGLKPAKHLGSDS